jgi:biopolymer transport protein ExbD
MAELDTKPAAANAGNKVKTNKKSTRVDLTAMVDLAFLLITFFILTTTLQKPNAMELVMPDKKGDHTLAVPESRTMTVLIGAKNKLEWFMGSPDKPLSAPTVDDFGKDGIRKALFEQSEHVKQLQGKDMIVLVKASAHSNYANMVDLMDELNIANIQRRAVVDITPVDEGLLRRDGIFEK